MRLTTPTAIAALSAGALAACQQQAPETGAAGLADENAALAEEAYAAFAAGDMDALFATFAEDILWYEAENHPYAAGNPYVGAEAIAAGVFSHIGTDWNSFAVEIDAIHASGDTVFATGRYVGEYGDGTPFDAQVAHVWTVENGKLARFQQYTDTFQWRAVAGD